MNSHMHENNCLIIYLYRVNYVFCFAHKACVRIESKRKENEKEKVRKVTKRNEKTRIEPVGKPYREVCLQTLLWPWKVHRPSSWSLYLSELALKLKEFFFFFLFFKWLFWVVLNILSTNELQKKISWVFVGFDQGSSESGVRRSTDWATRAKLTRQ